jgi:GNAT superfamily N-acetyltransferase
MDMEEGTPVGLRIVTAAEQRDLWEETDGRFREVWPEYNLHGEVADRYFSALLDRFAPLQFLVIDVSTGAAVARGRTIPFRWDGSLDDLPSGIDAVGMRAITSDDGPTALSALAAEVPPEHRGRGLSTVVIRTMAGIARREGLERLVAPVRPSWKDRYPLVDIARYVTWRRPDGLPFDPWMRVHQRLGGTILRPEPRSLQITAPVADWETWTGIRYPEDGAYTFPGGLAPLNVKQGIGHYWEPNVWILHQLD